jgi:hypothetical protein
MTLCYAWCHESRNGGDRLTPECTYTLHEYELQCVNGTGCYRLVGGRERKQAVWPAAVVTRHKPASLHATFPPPPTPHHHRNNSSSSTVLLRVAAAGSAPLVYPYRWPRGAGERGVISWRTTVWREIDRERERVKARRESHSVHRHPFSVVSLVTFCTCLQRVVRCVITHSTQWCSRMCSDFYPHSDRTILYQSTDHLLS